MKLGWIGHGKLKSKYKPAVSENWFSTSPQGTFHMLYPDELSAIINLKDPDYDLCAEMDAILYMSGTHNDPFMIDVIDKIPCKVLSYHEGGEQDFLTWTLDEVLINREIMDKSDLVLVWDTRALGLHRLYTTTKVLWWPLPYPVEYFYNAIARVGFVPGYDILIAYAPYMWQSSTRNSIAGCMLAQNLIDNDLFSTAGVFSGARDDNINYDKSFLEQMGLNKVDVIPFVPPDEFLAMISKAKMVINLDYRRASGRITLECALTRTPVIATGQQPFAYQIYNGIKLHDHYDINSMIETATMISKGNWPQEWLDLAYERAQHYSMANKARALEEAVMQL